MHRAFVLLAALALATLTPGATAQDVQPVVDASQYRFDFGTMMPGAEQTGTFELRNAGAIPAAVELQPEGASTSFLTLSRTTFNLLAGEDAVVDFVYRVPRDTAPGDHGEAVRIKVAPLALLGKPTSGSLDAGTAILFTSRAASVGLLAIEAPGIVAPDAGFSGRVLAVNTDARPATVTARVAVIGADGAAIASRDLGTITLAPDTSGAWEYSFDSTELPPGEHTLRATMSAADAAGPGVSLAQFDKPLAIGSRAALFEIVDIVDEGNGVATFTIRIKNTGTVPATLHPVLTIQGANGNGPDAAIDPITLLPGEEREITASLDVPPGDWTAILSDRVVDGIVIDTTSSDRAFTMGEARVPAPDGAPGGAAWIRVAGLLTFGLFAAVGAGAFVVPRLRRRARRPRAPVRAHEPHSPLEFRVRSPDPRAAPTLVPRPEPAPFPAPAPARAPARVEPLPVPREHELAVFVDLDSLGAEAPLVEILRASAPDEPPSRAAGYRSVASQKLASKTYHAMQHAGFTPHVRIAESAAAKQSHVAIALDVMDAAAAGAQIVLATHDASYADLVSRLVARGAKVQVLGYEGEVPVALLEAATSAILLPAREA